jgi:hypothetical protein
MPESILNALMMPNNILNANDFHKETLLMMPESILDANDF